MRGESDGGHLFWVNPICTNTFLTMSNSTLAVLPPEYQIHLNYMYNFELFYL